MLIAKWSLFVAFCYLPVLPESAHAAERPNVLIMMVDDLGYSDIGCFGGEIETPVLDQLAGRGLRLSQFYNTAKCHSSRVCLLTGQYCIAAGDVGLSHAVTSAETLDKAGYFTAMTGKWHLKQQPTDFGFRRYFGHLSGACNYFKGDRTFRLNGETWSVPQSDFYTTTANVDYALRFLTEARDTKKPWCLYVAFNAPHAPLHALPQDYAKYAGRYRQGWDAIREARFEKQKRLGLLPLNLMASPRPEHIPEWKSLSAARKTFEIKRMQTLAAMIDRVDQEIGRLVNDLQTNGELDNTVIWFVSDNGACPYDRRSSGIHEEPTSADVTFGDSTGWAWARNCPFRYYKQNQFEGGISSPAIIHWPVGLKTQAGAIRNQPSHLVDVLPTLADVCDAPIPDTWPQRDVRPGSGVSLRPLFENQSLVREEPIHLLFSKDRGLRDGDWKAVSFRGEAWELYNMAVDRAETMNLADRNPDRLKAMAGKWTQMARDVLHAPRNVYGPTSKAKLPHQHHEWTNFDKEPVSGDQRSQSSARNGARKSAGSAGRQQRISGIRARKNTAVKLSGSEISLTFSGNDPGLAFDRLGENLEPGPYVLSFRLAARASGAGEVFYTTTSDTSLPNGDRIGFDVSHDGLDREVRIVIPVTTRIYKLRLDVCGDGDGTATVKDLMLLREAGEVAMRWPSQ